MRALWVSSYSPFPPESGGELRVHHLLKGAIAAGIEVELWVIDEEGRGAADPGWPGLTVVTLTQRRRDSPADKARAVASGRAEYAWALRTPETLARTAGLQPGAFDVVVLEHAHAGGLAAELARVAPLVLDAHNVEWRVAGQMSRHAARLHRRVRFALESARTRRLEADLMARCALVAAVSEADATAFRALGGSARVVVRPNGVDLAAIPWRDHTMAAGARVLMTGHLGYLPNVDAATWLCGEILPELRKLVPEVRLRIAGRAPTAEVRAAVAAANATLLADVLDMPGVLGAADVFIAPLRMGGGTRIKVLEALAAGLPVVATDVAIEGLDLPDSDLVLLANSPARLAQAVRDALTDTEHRRRVGRAGREFVERNHSWEEIGAAFAADLERVAK